MSGNGLMQQIGRVWLAGALIALVLPTAQGASSSATSPAFRVGITSPVDSVNPLWMSWSPTGLRLQNLTYDTLLKTDPSTGEPRAGLADSWGVSADGLTWTFHLRDGPTWSDGVPLTAQDVAWSAHRLMNGSLSDGTFDSTVSVVARDDHTVVWTTKQPGRPPPLYGLASLILPQHVFAQMDENELSRADNYPDPVVSGPLIQRWNPRTGWTLAARPDYWGGRPAVDPDPGPRVRRRCGTRPGAARR